MLVTDKTIDSSLNKVLTCLTSFNSPDEVFKLNHSKYFKMRLSSQVGYLYLLNKSILSPVWNNTTEFY